MQETATTELALAEGAPGFRLNRVELYNWGTFGKKVWSFPVAGKNALVTGDIGSGKSTWVDALSTLLVPPQRITYNKAAGAERRERTDRGYLLGEYMRSRVEDSSYAKPVNLRGDDCFSVILAVFRDESASRLVSLAQLRWLKGGEMQRIYAVSGKPLSVLGDFKDFDGDGPAFRKKLKLRSEAETFDSFSDYSERFRSDMGVTMKAIDLFNQTISMKTIGDLDDFIRNHMLERTNARDSIEGLLRNYDNLRSAHDAVARTREQREALRPMEKEAIQHEELAQELDGYSSMLDGLPFWAISLELPLLEAETERLEEARQTTTADLTRVDGALREKRESKVRIRSAIENSEAGRRIAELDVELKRLDEERVRRNDRARVYRDLASRLRLDEPAAADVFFANRITAEKEQKRAESETAVVRREREERIVKQKAVLDGKAEIEAELLSLRTRSTSIPLRELTLRAELAGALEADESELPFAGELMRVRSSERRWEGAAERVLRPLALSLLVPDRLYRKAATYIRERDLRDRRLVFYRVPEKSESVERTGERSLARTIEVKEDSPFRPWLESEVMRRAVYERCETMAEFFRLTDAVTQEGLIKSGRLRHEKDDRRRISDPRYFVLGWSNKEKIRLFEQDLSAKTVELDELNRTLADGETALENLDKMRYAARELLAFDSFEDIDWRACASRYQAFSEERDGLEQSSDQLTKLRESLAATDAAIERLDRERDGLLTRSGSLNKELEEIRETLEMKKRNLAVIPRETLSPVYERLRAFLNNEEPGLDELRGTWQDGVRQRLMSKRNTVERKDSDVKGSLVKRMTQFLAQFPERSSELAPGMDFLDSFREALKHIERDDLPALENRFRELLRESTLQDIALFQNELDTDAERIKQAIGFINDSLRMIEYNPGTYISLSVLRREDQDIADFRAAMRRCLENTLADDEQYSEGKFLHVKWLLDRFASGQSEDRNWTEYVTDVRSWFTFTASERWDEDDTEKEFYSSSSGKSGGQKEKLAYTILASALAYQYGLGRKRLSGGFRLVAIDEAFGRGSEESTRYGLRLFQKLDLQLVLVTPLQKIGIIEEYVSSIHFITNPEGSASEVRNLGVEEYRREKRSRSEKAPT